MTIALVVGPRLPGEEHRDDTHPYYVIVDVETNTPLAYISSVPVNVGDELITRQNRLYRVISVVENTAYAQFIREIDLSSWGTENPQICGFSTRCSTGKMVLMKTFGENPHNMLSLKG
jgi:hypothetical protein